MIPIIAEIGVINNPSHVKGFPTYVLTTPLELLFSLTVFYSFQKEELHI